MCFDTPITVVYLQSLQSSERKWLIFLPRFNYTQIIKLIWRRSVKFTLVKELIYHKVTRRPNSDGNSKTLAIGKILNY